MDLSRSTKRARAAETELSYNLEFASSIRGLGADDDAERDRAMRELNEQARKFREAHPEPAKDEAAANAIIASLVAFLSKANILAVCPAYRQGDWFEKLAAAAAGHLAASCKSVKAWQDALDIYEGANSVPYDDSQKQGP